VRIRFTLDITRGSKPAPEPQREPIFEHRDNDTMVEATYGGDHTRHRMGFVPAPEYGEE
jgi:hypothetical protein